MTDLVPTFSGETQLMSWGESDTQGPWVKLRLVDSEDLIAFKGMTRARGGVAGQRLACVLVEIQDNETPSKPPEAEDKKNIRVMAVPDSADETKPFGSKAAKLYGAGFFFNQKAMEKAGNDQVYLDWLKTQACCVRGSMIADKAHAGDIVPAHVRRIAAGAGTGIKPEFSAVPMCDRHHKLQHQHGESAVGGKDFFDRERARHLSRWMAQTVFSKESMGQVDPQNMRTWCFMNDIQQYLPESY